MDPRKAKRLASIAKELYDTREMSKFLKEKDKELSGKLLTILNPKESVNFITDEGEEYFVRHEVSVNPVLTTDFEVARKFLLKRELMLVLSISVSKVRELFGDKIVKALTVTESTSDCCKFYPSK